jgi:hypothetical protein
MKYTGVPSRFEGRTVAPPGPIKTGFQVIAVDPAGNTGVHTLDLTVGP